MKIEESMNLTKIEKILNRRVNGITIISQIPMGSNELNTIVKAIKVPLSSYDQKHMITTLWRNYPYSCMVITVFIAILKYDGNFWDHFRRILRVQKTGLWKKLFIETIERKELTMFDRDGNQKYLSNILGHAGIPRQNAGIFLRDVIIPACDNGMDANDICRDFQHEKSSRIKSYHLYKGVIDFIKLGDEVSLTLIDRCLKVWKEQQLPFYENNKGFLPPHILKEFDKYLEKEETIVAPKTISNWKPKLKINPNTLKIFIQLPFIKSYDSSIRSVKWIVNDISNHNKVQVLATKVTLSNQVTEFLIEDYQKNVEVKPENSYSVQLFINNVLESEEEIETNDFIVFNTNTNEKVEKLKEEYKELIIVTQNRYVERDLGIHSTVFQSPMEQDWKSYTMIDIEATHKEQLNIGDYTIYLSNKDSIPFLDGKEIENVSHERLPMYKKAPNIIIPMEFTPFFNNKKNFNIKVFSKSKRETVNLTVQEFETTYIPEIGARISLEQSKLINKFDFGEYELTFYGPLGSDITFSFIVCPDFDLQIKKGKKETKIVSFEIPFNYSSDVIWPDYLNVRKEVEEDRKRIIHIECPLDVYKLVVQFTDTKTGESFPFSIFTKLFDAKVNYQKQTYPVGTVTDRTTLNLEETYLHLNFENPSLNKYKEGDSNIVIKSHGNDKEAKTFTKKIRVGKKSIIPLKYFSESSQKSYIALQYKLPPILNDFENLIYIDNDWKLEELSYDVSNTNLLIQWKDNFPMENLQLKIWNLSCLKDTPVTIDLGKGQNDITIEKLDAGFYLFEWKEKDDNPFNFLFGGAKDSPSFHKNKSRMIKMGTDASLTALALLEDADGKEYERDKSELLALLSSINSFGDSFLHLLLNDYDACCDFGIRNIDCLLEILQSNEIEANVKSIAMQLSGFPEWDTTSLKEFIKDSISIQDSHLVSLENINTNYFGDQKTMQFLVISIQAQLNMTYQKLPFTDIIIKNFSLSHAHIEFVKKVKQKGTYFNKANNLVEKEIEFVERLYKKLKKSKQFDYRIFVLVDKREYNIEGQLIYQFPSLLGKVALFNRFLSLSELSFSEYERKRIRAITKELMDLEKNWLVHDLIYISISYEAIKKQGEYKLEGRKNIGHTSFKWKERN